MIATAFLMIAVFVLLIWISFNFSTAKVAGAISFFVIVLLILIMIICWRLSITQRNINVLSTPPTIVYDVQSPIYVISPNEQYRPEHLPPPYTLLIQYRMPSPKPAQQRPPPYDELMNSSSDVLFHMPNTIPDRIPPPNVLPPQLRLPVLPEIPRVVQR